MKHTVASKLLLESVTARFVQVVMDRAVPITSPPALIFDAMVCGVHTAPQTVKDDIALALFVVRPTKNIVDTVQAIDDDDSVMLEALQYLLAEPTPAGCPVDLGTLSNAMRQWIH